MTTCLLTCILKLLNFNYIYNLLTFFKQLGLFFDQAADRFFFTIHRTLLSNFLRLIATNLEKSIGSHSKATCISCHCTHWAMLVYDPTTN